MLPANFLSLLRQLLPWLLQWRLPNMKNYYHQGKERGKGECQVGEIKSIIQKEKKKVDIMLYRKKPEFHY